MTGIDNYEIKRKLYEAGAYRMPAPDVCTVNWDVDSWIKFIDQCGIWETQNVDVASLSDGGGDN